MDFVLKAEEIRKSFKIPTKTGAFKHRSEEKTVVDNVSFTLSPGEILGILGQSGSGKTTLVRTLLRLTEPNHGRAFLKIHDNKMDVFSLNRSEMKTKVRPYVRMIFQDPDAVMNPSYTVRHIIEQAKFGNRYGNRSIPELLEMVSLKDYYMDKYPHELSGGEKRRVSICRALATDPLIIFADEAVSGVDVTIKRDLLGLFRHMCDAYKIAIVFISHDISAVTRICDRIAIMYSGKFVEIGDRNRISRERGLHPYTQLLYDSSIEMDKPISDSLIAKIKHKRNNRIHLGCVYEHNCPIQKVDKLFCQNIMPELKSVLKENDQHRVACHYLNDCESLIKLRKKYLPK